MQQILRNMLGRPKLEEEHRGILQALQGAHETRLLDLLVTLADMGLVKDEGRWAQEVKVARQQLERAAEVSPACLSCMPAGCSQVLVLAQQLRQEVEVRVVHQCRGRTHTSLRCRKRMRQGDCMQSGHAQECSPLGPSGGWPSSRHRW